MPDLAERTKIRTEKGFETSTTTGWTSLVHAPILYFGHLKGDVLDANIYSWDNGSIRLQSIPYLSQPSVKAREMIKKILQYKYLPPGWDGESAEPPNMEIISKAIAFIASADEFDLPFYFTAPGPNGEIIVEFKSNTKTGEIYFNEDGSTEMILYNGNDQVYANQINMDLLTQNLR